jgi:hypothetical protein
MTVGGHVVDLMVEQALPVELKAPKRWMMGTTPNVSTISKYPDRGLA